ncbi:MAG: hypothetical protein HY560_14200 [Gemmatimonadetes bacterium]|nr:hypothetical protein [Gemmatimonadota bacterium]
MKERSEDGAPQALPRDWLPDPHPSEDAPVWDTRARRIMAAAGPELRRLKGRRSAAEVSWWSMMALWWKSAAAVAAVATALLLVQRPAAFPEPPPGSIPLGLIAADGEPVTLWGALGIQADPVLALIAIREQRDVTGQRAPQTIPQEENR